MKFVLIFTSLLSFICTFYSKTIVKKGKSEKKSNLCPRTFLKKSLSERTLMKYGSRCASINEDNLAYEYYLKAIEAANYSSRVISKVAKELNRSGKQALSKKILTSVESKRTSRATTEEIYSKLLEWAKKNNAKIGPVAIRELSESNRYFISTRDILTGEVIISIPKKLCLFSSHPELVQIQKTIDQNKSFKGLSIHARNTVAFSTYIMKSMKEGKGFFTPYLNSFPRTVNEYADYSLLTNASSIPFIKNSFFEQIALQFLDSYKDQLEEIKVVYPELKNYTLEEYVKAGIMFTSRNFDVVVNKSKVTFLIPFADLFNHDHHKKNADWRFNPHSNSLEIIATKDIKKGDEVFISYGFKDSSYFLIGYGFIPNKYLRDHSFFFEDNDVITKHMAKEPIPIKLNTYGDSIFQVLRYYRKFYIIPEQRKLNTDFPISIENEKSSIKAIISALSKRLSRYPTSLHYDKIQTKNKKLTDLQRNIFKVLVEEKTALMNSLKNLKLISDVLDKYDPNKIHIIKSSLFSKGVNFMKYFDLLRKTLRLKIFYS